VQKLRKKSKKVKKKEIYNAIVLKTKKKIKIKTGYTKIFSCNSVVLLNKQKTPIATRILTSIPYLLKKKKLQKIINLSLGII
jgi:large subunit ribosomal protein L14